MHLPLLPFIFFHILTPFQREQQQASIDELTTAKEELESNLASFESERRQLKQTIDQLERKMRSCMSFLSSRFLLCSSCDFTPALLTQILVGNGGSSTEIDQYVEKLEEELNKLKQEKTQIEALGTNNQKVPPPSLPLSRHHPFFNFI